MQFSLKLFKIQADFNQEVYFSLALRIVTLKRQQNNVKRGTNFEKNELINKLF